MHFTTWPLDLGDPKAKFHVKPRFKFAKMKLTGPERILLRKCGTEYQAFEEGTSTSTSGEYNHFIMLVRTYEERSISSTDAYKDFIKQSEETGQVVTEEERVWLNIERCLRKRKD